jgi:ring-1,2-phenylacetyl-CoA epoxidase subunit PaaE
MFFFNLRVADIRQETSDTKTICFKQPGLKKIRYLPGQYLTLIFRINGRKYIRPYSFSSAPDVDEYLEVTVKRVSGGVVSNHINDFLKVGDVIEVGSPIGDFVFDTKKITDEKTVVLWGAGSGVTPLISIAKYILYKSTGNKVRLVYGNRSLESVIFKTKIEEMERSFPGDFKTVNFQTNLTIDERKSGIIPGRIEPDRVLLTMKQELDIDNTVHYICGPSGLKESVKKSLKNLSIKEEMIFSEDFELVKNPADFESVFTRVVEIVKGGLVNKVEVTKGKSILEAGIDASIDLEYSCQTGSCAICKARLISGNVKTIGVETLPSALNADECLLCCSYPLSNDVRVSVAG